MYDEHCDMIHLSRPQYDDLPAMSMSDRAAQFSPFAALVGYDDAVGETARLTDSRYELTEDDINELNAELDRLLDILGEKPVVRVVHFVPDERKAGGRYAEKLGTVRIYDSYENALVFTDGERIKVEDMFTAEIVSLQA